MSIEISTLRAFHNDPAVKAFYMDRVKQHAFYDEIIQGTYWENGKGCAVGCTIHDCNHTHYVSKLGIPEDLPYLQDHIFEGLSNKEAKKFPLQFLEAIPVGADLSLIAPKLILWLLIDEQHGVIQYAQNEPDKEIVRKISTLYQRFIDGETVEDYEFFLARHTAYRSRAHHSDYTAMHVAERAMNLFIAEEDEDKEFAEDIVATAITCAMRNHPNYENALTWETKETQYEVVRDALLRLLEAAPHS